ncbi:hypothetical protein [Pantanalinema sp. GBBB05]|uniref:hypothetical protein n=1 Tax=Pantanalinema sp. GBBB05 TaxID=2604139 RepID=UPI001D7D43C7|nr:hypothetical protein [Pantanalinema sp. GBBB05]
MIERIEVLSREELLLQTLTDLIRAVVATGTANYNPVIAEVYAEFTRELMVGQAEAAMGLAYPESLLRQAGDAIERRVQERLGEIRFNLSRYKEGVAKALKVPAKEVLALQEDLKQARRQDEIPMYGPNEYGEHTPFWISEVGLKRSEIQALVALPDDRQCYLDFGQIAEDCTRRGEWFPFELIVQDSSIGELVFVVDQNGSIQIHTDNFPAEALSRVRNILKYIAGKIYVEPVSDDSEWVDM